MSRAVELCHTSGRPASALQRTARDVLTGFQILKLGLNPERALLYEKLNDRTQWMFANGLVEETQQLMTLDGDSEVLRSLGYAQAVKYLKSEWPIETAIADCQMKTRNYAKRQMTWFRADPHIKWINEFGSSDKAKRTALDIAGTFLGQLGTPKQKKGICN